VSRDGCPFTAETDDIEELDVSAPTHVVEDEQWRERRRDRFKQVADQRAAAAAQAGAASSGSARLKSSDDSTSGGGTNPRLLRAMLATGESHGPVNLSG
jgi:hypothetical protein